MIPLAQSNRRAQTIRWAALVVSVAALALVALLGARSALSSPLPPERAADPLQSHKLLRVQQPSNGKTRAVVIFLHGGGWLSASELGERPIVEGPLVDRLSERGVAFAYADYRSGARSIPSSLRAYREIRERFPGRPICAWGGSAGAHLALMTAELGASYDCVVAEAPPVGISALISHLRDSGISWLADQVEGFWPTRSQQAEASPVARVRELASPTLIAAGTCDPLIPLSSVERYYQRARARAQAEVQLVVGHAGSAPGFAHCSGAARSDVNRFKRLRWQLLSGSLGVER